MFHISSPLVFFFFFQNKKWLERLEKDRITHLSTHSSSCCWQSKASSRTKTAYRNSVSQLVAWGTENNLTLNVGWMVEMVIDLLTPLLIPYCSMAFTETVKFLGVTIPSILQSHHQVSSRVRACSITVWCTTSSAHTKHRLECIVQTANWLIGPEQIPVNSLHANRART